METLIPIKFTSRGVEQEVRRTCAVHGIPFDALERYLNNAYTLVEPGVVNLALIDIGHRRILENPSRRLEGILHYCMDGFLLGMAAQGLGKPILGDSHEPDLAEQVASFFGLDDLLI